MDYQDFSQTGRWWLAANESDWLAIDLSLVYRFQFSRSVNGESIRVWFTDGDQVCLSDEAAASLREALVDYISAEDPVVEEGQLDFFYV